MSGGGAAGPVRVLLLAGGLGTRLRPLTDRVPKCLVPVAGRPLLDYWLDRFAAAGLREIRINTHHLPERVREYLAQVNACGRFRITEAYEPTLLGSAGTVAANRDLADGASEVLIVYADNLSDVDLAEMLAYHRGHGDPLTMMLFRAPRPERCGIATLDDAGRVLRFVEKPTHPESDLANAGLYALTADAYREVADLRAFDFGFDVLPRFVGRMRGWPWPGYHLDIGTPEALARASADAALWRDQGPGIRGQGDPGGRPAPAPTTDEGAGRDAQGSSQAHGPWPLVPAPRPAVFLDRDGTVIEAVHYLRDPAAVRLLPGAAAAIARLRAEGYACVVVSNQSAVGRGLLTVAGLEAVHAEFCRQLAAAGAGLDGWYFCPTVPTSDDRATIDDPDRKPGPGMLRRAAAELGLDLGRSWMVGDMLSDVLAGRNAGCGGLVLVTCGQGAAADLDGLDCPCAVVPDLAAAADHILAAAARSGAGPGLTAAPGPGSRGRS